jgi:hypothetical protein
MIEVLILLLAILVLLRRLLTFLHGDLVEFINKSFDIFRSIRDVLGIPLLLLLLLSLLLLSLFLFITST